MAEATYHKAVTETRVVEVQRSKVVLTLEEAEARTLYRILGELPMDNGFSIYQALSKSGLFEHVAD